MKSNPKLNLIVGSFLFLVTAAVLAIIVNNQLSPDDSGALFGGRVEFGYPSAGFLVVVTKSGSVKSCGFTPLNNTTGVTASHCVDDAQDIYVGHGEFNTNTSSLLRAERAVQKRGWIDEKRRDQDFAILTFKPNDKLVSFADIATPEAGCHFRVVAYGRTEDQDANSRPRKSSLLCGSDVNSLTFTVTGADSGICFGDSGSPVFYEETKQLAGVIASVIQNDKSTVCSFNNTAIVVRADSNLNLVNANLGVGSQTPVSAQDGIIIEVADEGFLERIGLAAVANFAKDNRGVLLVALAGVVLMVGIIYVIKRPKPKQQRRSVSGMVLE